MSYPARATQWLHVCLSVVGENLPVIYNADSPVTCPSVHTRTGTVATSRLFDYEWSMLHQQDAESSTSDAAHRAWPVSFGCHPRLTRLSRLKRSPAKTAGQSSVLHLHLLLWVKLQPFRGTQSPGEAFLVCGCANGQGHEPKMAERAPPLSV